MSERKGAAARTVDAWLETPEGRKAVERAEREWRALRLGSAILRLIAHLRVRRAR